VERHGPSSQSADAVQAIVVGISGRMRLSGTGGKANQAAGRVREVMARIAIKRIYDPPAEEDGFRVLVDRVWPRGVSKKEAAIEHWAKDIGPSTELRKWFNHDPARWQEFRKRYQGELKDRVSDLRQLLKERGRRRMTLLFSARDTEHNQAIVLKDVLERM
jgi:uncharacterized protein YeaO (DUF488 family)